MHSRFSSLIIFIILVFFTSSVVAIEATDTSCGHVNSDLTISTDILVNGSCLIVNASNIVIDGGDFTLLGNGSGTGLNVTAMTNVTLRNFAGLDNFTYTIYSKNSNNLLVANNSMTSANITNAYTVFFNKVTDSKLVNNTLIGTYSSMDVLLLVSSSDNNHIIGNVIHGVSDDGIRITASSNNSFISNNVSAKNNAVEFTSSTEDNFFFNNTFLGLSNGAVIDIDGSADNNIFLSNILNGTKGVLIHSTSNNYKGNNFTLNTIHSSSTCIDLNEGTGDWFFGDSLVGCTEQFNIDEGIANITNVSFDRDAISHSGSSTGYMNVHWLLGVNVTDGSAVLSDAQVNISDVSSNLVFSGITASDGTITVQHVAESFINETGWFYYSPHNITVSKDGYSSVVEEVNLTAVNNTLLSITLTAESSSSDSSSSSSSGGSSGGGGGSGGSSCKEIRRFSSISPGDPLDFTLSNGLIPVEQISIIPLYELINVKLSVECSSSFDDGLPESLGTVYKYLSFSSTGFDEKDVDSSTFYFCVNATWLQDQELSRTNVGLAYYENGWDILNISYVTKADGEYCYDIESEVLGEFAIFAEVSEEEETVEQDEEKVVVEEVEDPLEDVTELYEDEPLSLLTGFAVADLVNRRETVFVFLGLLLVALIIRYTIYRKRKRPANFSY